MNDTRVNIFFGRIGYAKVNNVRDVDVILVGSEIIWLNP